MKHLKQHPFLGIFYFILLITSVIYAFNPDTALTVGVVLFVFLFLTMFVTIGADVAIILNACPTAVAYYITHWLPLSHSDSLLPCQNIQVEYQVDLQSNELRLLMAFLLCQ